MSALQNAHPKIQKMCEEESEDHEAVAKLLEINDSIHRTIERYKLIRKGDLEGAAKIPKGTLGTSGAGVSKGSGNELSLIDLGDPEEVMLGGSSNPPNAMSDSQTSALEDDLLGLNIGQTSSGVTGGISLGAGSQTGMIVYLDQIRGRQLREQVLEISLSTCHQLDPLMQANLLRILTHLHLLITQNHRLASPYH